MHTTGEKGNTPLKSFSLFFMCITFIFISISAYAKGRISNEQRFPDSPNPRENVAFLEKEIEDFKLRMLPLLEGKSRVDATAIFFTEVEVLYNVVGQPFKWPWTNFYDLYVFGSAHNVQWEPDYCIRGIPSSSEISEEEAIAIAQKTVLSLTATSPEVLEMYWASTSYYKTHADREYSWYVSFLVETPMEKSPYYIKFALEIDPKTGHIYSFFDSRSNDI